MNREEAWKKAVELIDLIDPRKNDKGYDRQQTLVATHRVSAIKDLAEWLLEDEYGRDPSVPHIPVLTPDTAWLLPDDARAHVVTMISAFDDGSTQIAFAAIDSEAGQLWLKKRLESGLSVPSLDGEPIVIKEPAGITNIHNVLIKDGGDFDASNMQEPKWPEGSEF